MWTGLNTLSSSQSANLRSLLSYHIPARSLCSSNTNLLSVSRVHTTFASRGFSVAAPSVWNSLPAGIRACSSSHTFRRLLKTHCFNQAFSSLSGSHKCLRFTGIAWVIGGWGELQFYRPKKSQAKCLFSAPSFCRPLLIAATLQQLSAGLRMIFSRQTTVAVCAMRFRGRRSPLQTDRDRQTDRQAESHVETQAAGADGKVTV